MEYFKIKDVDLMEAENLLNDYYNFLQTLVEENESDELSRQAQMFRLENIIDTIDGIMGVLNGSNN